MPLQCLGACITWPNYMAKSQLMEITAHTRIFPFSTNCKLSRQVYTTHRYTCPVPLCSNRKMCNRARASENETGQETHANPQHESGRMYEYLIAILGLAGSLLPFRLQSRNIFDNKLHFLKPEDPCTVCALAQIGLFMLAVKIGLSCSILHGCIESTVHCLLNLVF